MTTTATAPFARSFAEADDTMHTPFGDFAVIRADGLVFAHGPLPPGWRWSKDVKPIAGTELCQENHTHYVVSGRGAFRMADGTEYEMNPGDLCHIPAGHDGWVVGDEPLVTIDITRE